MLSDEGTMTPYSTVVPLISEEPHWVPDLDVERVASYAKYDELYWNNSEAFKLIQRDAGEVPIYIPNPRAIVDSTAHFLLKGLEVMLGDGDPDNPNNAFFGNFLKRERFHSKFHTAKTSGVARGDYIFHVTANPAKPQDTRISIESVDPASYFPITDEWDPDTLLGVDLVEQFRDPENLRVYVRRQRYTYVVVQGRRRVQSEQALYELEYWWHGQRARKYKEISKPRLLPADITTIPVYHFRNIDWQGQDFGSSELRGYERIMSSINQSVSDEEIALALEGLGVYATDAGPPEDDQGNEEDWIIAPAKVLEVPAGAYFRRVEGVGSVQPMQDHIGYLTEALYQSSGTFRPALIDVKAAQSGIALALKFLPTLAKIEQRDWDGIDKLTQMFYDIKQWFRAYENTQLKGDIVVQIGDKLPQDRVAQLNELNNMLDRKIISRKYYRAQMRKFGYDIPADDMDQLIAEEKELAEARIEAVGAFQRQTVLSMDDSRQSNNAERTNESNGTEA